MQSRQKVICCHNSASDVANKHFDGALPKAINIAKSTLTIFLNHFKAYKVINGIDCYYRDFDIHVVINVLDDYCFDAIKSSA
jgi:hypothetical protein